MPGPNGNLKNLTPEERIQLMVSRLVSLVDGRSFPGRQNLIGKTIHELQDEVDAYFGAEGEA